MRRLGGDGEGPDEDTRHLISRKVEMEKGTDTGGPAHAVGFQCS